jgi:hypothetical protein
MSEDPGSAPCGESLQSAFDRLADGLDLRLEAPQNESRLRTIGIAIACIRRIVDAEIEKDAPPIGATDDRAIGEVIRGYETMAPEEFVRRWKEFSTDPHVGIGWSWLAPINTEVVDGWLEREELKEVLRAFPPYSPRRITISDLRIVYIGDTRAAATYRIEEEHTNSKVSGGNTVAILMKIDKAGWKIVAVSKGGREVLRGDAGDRPE